MKFYLIILTLFPQLAFAGICKVVTEIGSVTYSNVRLENSTRLDVLDKRWKLVSEEGITEDRLYYDSKNIKKNSKSILVWAMKITDTEITKNFYDFSCQANTYSVLQIESKQVKKEPKFIIPDTDTEKVFDAVCKK